MLGFRFPLRCVLVYSLCRYLIALRNFLRLGSTSISNLMGLLVMGCWFPLRCVLVYNLCRCLIVLQRFLLLTLGFYVSFKPFMGLLVVRFSFPLRCVLVYSPCRYLYRAWALFAPNPRALHQFQTLWVF